jgi:hypothetical protein
MWWLLMSVLEIILGLSCIVLAIKYKFNERFYSVRESYMKMLDTRFKSYGSFLKNVDRRSQERYP